MGQLEHAYCIDIGRRIGDALRTAYAWRHCPGMLQRKYDTRNGKRIHVKSSHNVQSTRGNQSAVSSSSLFTCPSPSFASTPIDLHLVLLLSHHLLIFLRWQVKFVLDGAHRHAPGRPLVCEELGRQVCTKCLPFFSVFAPPGHWRHPDEPRVLRHARLLAEKRTKLRKLRRKQLARPARPEAARLRVHPALVVPRREPVEGGLGKRLKEQSGG